MLSTYADHWGNSPLRSENVINSTSTIDLSNGNAWVTPLLVPQYTTFLVWLLQLEEEVSLIGTFTFMENDTQDYNDWSILVRASLVLIILSTKYIQPLQPISINKYWNMSPLFKDSSDNPYQKSQPRHSLKALWFKNIIWICLSVTLSTSLFLGSKL